MTTQREQDLVTAGVQYDIVNDHDDQLRFFADGAAYARQQVIKRLHELFRIELAGWHHRDIEILINELEKP